MDKMGLELSPEEWEDPDGNPVGFEQEGFKNSLAVVHGKKWVRKN